MRIRVLSDLHREFGSVDLPNVAADVVVLAGDIERGIKGFAWARQAFPGVTWPATTSITTSASDGCTKSSEKCLKQLSHDPAASCCDSCAENAGDSAPSSFAEPANKPSLHPLGQNCIAQQHNDQKQPILWREQDKPERVRQG